jgi:phage/plasmid-associated DNA primase
VKREKWDTKLQEKLRGNISEFIHFAVMGLRKLRDDDYVIKESEAMMHAKEEYAGMTESFSGFCDEYIKYDSDIILTSADIKKAYHHYCDTKGYVELKDNQWAGLLQKAYGAMRVTKTINKDGVEKRVRAYRGVDFKKSLKDLIDEDAPEDPASISTIF